MEANPFSFRFTDFSSNGDLAFVNSSAAYRDFRGSGFFLLLRIDFNPAANAKLGGNFIPAIDFKTTD